MNLEAQIELINNPQDFTRLYNAVLIAEYGDNYVPIDDDRADEGNDGYLKSEKRLFAGHCFKRIQKQQLDNEIHTKMSDDLKKAIKLKEEGIWEIENWTFLSNYPISESVAKPIIALGKKAKIDVSWRGPQYFAEALQKHKSIRAQFPNLQVNEIMEQLEVIIEKRELPTNTVPLDDKSVGVPNTIEQQRALLLSKPGGWEYLLFAGVLFLGKEGLEFKWHDYELRYGKQTGKHLDNKEAIKYLKNVLADVSKATSGMVLAFDKDFQRKAFGPSGTPGDAKRIEHFANHIINSYEYLLDWAADLRGTGVSKNFTEAFEAAASLVRQPILEIREFVDYTVIETSKIPEYLQGPKDKPLRINLNLTLTIDNKDVTAFQEEMKKVAHNIH